MIAGWLLSAAGWFGRFLAYTLAVVLLGGLAAAVAFLLLGKLFVPDWSLGDLFLRGFKVGTILGGIWGSGLGVVLCFRDAYWRRQAKLTSAQGTDQ